MMTRCWMLTAAVALLAVLSCVAMVAQATTMAKTTSPLVMFSKNELFRNGFSTDSSAPLDAMETTRLFRTLAGKMSSTFLADGASAPQAVVLFVYPELNWNSFVEELSHFNYIQAEQSAASSSLTLPMVSGSASLATLSKQFSRVLSLDAGKSSEAEMKTAMTAQLSDSRPALVLISVTFETPSALLSALATHAHSLASRAVIGVFGKSSGRSVELAFEAPEDALAGAAAPAHSFNTLATSSQTFCNVQCTAANYSMPSIPSFIMCNGTRVYPGPQYVTPNIIVAVSIMLFNLFILYIAIGCLMSVQRPVRMSTAPLILSKEY